MRRAAWLTLAAFIVSAVALGLRPQLIGMALFAVVLLLVTDRRAHPGRLWAVPVIVLVWANVHGSFFLGPLVLGLAWLEDVHDRVPRPHRLLLIAVVSAAAACVTPFGPAVWAYAFGLSTNSEVTARITEWQPTSLRSIPGILFFGSALAVVALIARRGRTTPWPTLAWLAVFFLIGAYAIRGVAWWPLGAVAAIAGRARDGTGRRSGATGGPRFAADAPAQPRRGRGDRRGRDRAAAGLAPDRTRPGRAGRCRRHRTARHHRRPARHGRPDRPAVQPAAVGLVVRVRAARPAGRDRFAHRALPGRHAGTPTRTSSPAARTGQHSSTAGA